MLNDPEYASKEEWDTYAWFGFAIQEAQAIERILLLIAVALKIREESSSSHEDRWFSLYDKLRSSDSGETAMSYSKAPAFTRGSCT